ncbi:MAG: diacylglycerol kinase family protein [Patescibacteria group bacterium]
MNIHNLQRSFHDAFRGLVYTFRYELSFRCQTLIAIIVLFLAFYFPLRMYERVVVILLVVLVLILELVNSVVERIIDLFRPRIDHVAKIIKDIMAGAVLLSAIFSAIIGWIIFWPHIKLLLFR